MQSEREEREKEHVEGKDIRGDVCRTGLRQQDWVGLIEWRLGHRCLKEREEMKGRSRREKERNC